MPRPRDGHGFQPTGIIFELVQDIIGMNLLTEKNAPPPWQHVFQANVTIFELIQHINKTNLLTIFREDWIINVASRVLTRKNAPAPWLPYIIGMNFLTKFHEDWTINVASRTNLLTEFHEDWTINVASRELTRQMSTPHNGQRTTDKRRSQKLTTLNSSRFIFQTIGDDMQKDGEDNTS
ncbi:hypothetical protein DPMN_115834 [Dreissena polymorpha]|uniref:Uncharacterized protein n=1 Tax=Dreissena polymorpha TaxID=45954 RepID=A0A9D4KN74_DREPO|nr:hypothetical protein DPMN_115834 [Dreissena polymorpha]